MTSSNPPLYYFQSIDFNDYFYQHVDNGISLSIANNNYLSRISNTSSTAPITTFNNSVTFGNSALNQTSANLDLYNQTASGTLTLRLNNNSSVPQTIMNLNSLGTNTSIFNGVSTNSTLINTTGQIASQTYNIPFVPTAITSIGQILSTDAAGHFQYNPNTNALSIGGTVNGTININGSASVLNFMGSGTVINAPSASAISAPYATITSASLTTSGGTVSITGDGSNTLLNGLSITSGGFFGRNDITANSFSGTKNTTRHPIGWTITASKQVLNTSMTSGVIFDVIQIGTPITAFTTLSNGIWMCNTNFNNGTITLGTNTILQGQQVAGANTTLLSTGYIQIVGSTTLSNFGLSYPVGIVQATGNGTGTNIILNFVITAAPLPSLNFNICLTKIA